MFRLQALIRQHEDELARLLSLEHGKTIEDAKGDLFRGLEVVEQRRQRARAARADGRGELAAVHAARVVAVDPGEGRAQAQRVDGRVVQLRDGRRELRKVERAVAEEPAQVALQPRLLQATSGGDQR